MNFNKYKELSIEESKEINGGIIPLGYLVVGAWMLGTMAGASYYKKP